MMLDPMRRECFFIIYGNEKIFKDLQILFFGRFYLSGEFHDIKKAKDRAFCFEQAVRSRISN